MMMNRIIQKKKKCLIKPKQSTTTETKKSNTPQKNHRKSKSQVSTFVKSLKNHSNNLSKLPESISSQNVCETNEVNNSMKNSFKGPEKRALSKSNTTIKKKICYK